MTLPIPPKQVTYFDQQIAAKACTCRPSSRCVMCTLFVSTTAKVDAGIRHLNVLLASR